MFLDKNSIMFHQRLKLVVFLYSLILKSYNCEIQLHEPEDNNDLNTCIMDILKKYYLNIDKLTYFDINVEGNGLIKAVNEMKFLPIVFRTSNHKLYIPNGGYLIHVRNISDIIKSYQYNTREPAWNPYAPHTIIIQSLQRQDLREIFNILMYYSIYNVIIVNGTSEAHVYSYDPFENFGCGKRIDRIMKLGKCSEVTTDLFPDKLSSSLKNCTINVSAPHWPPFSFDLTKYGNSLGVEQYAIKEICALEKLNLNFINNYDGEEFSLVSSDMMADGPLNMLQNKQIDVILGGMILIESRASAFCYVYGHLTYVDEIRIMVKKASFAPTWKNFYLEFEPSVWSILLVAYILYYLLLCMLLRMKVKNNLALKMLGNLVLHGSKLTHQHSGIKRFFIIWVWFTYLMNSFYQSSLVSLMNNPTKNYQISEEASLTKYNLKPCLSTVVKKFIYSQTERVYETNHCAECDTLLGSVKIVSKSKDVYTIVIYCRYSFEKQAFNDKWGSPLVYPFPKVFSKIIYGIFLNKGFPLCKRINQRALQLRENGLVQKYLEGLYYMREIQYYYHEADFKTRFAIPWIIYGAGIIVSVITFALEIVSTRRNQRL